MSVAVPHLLSSGTGATSIAGGGTSFLGTAGGSVSIVAFSNDTLQETRTIWRTAGVASLYLVTIITNDRTTNGTAHFNINAVAGNQSITIPSATTGRFQDASHTDSVSAGQTVQLTIVGGTGGTTCSYNDVGFAFTATGTAAVQRFIGKPPATQGTSNVYGTIAAAAPSGLTEANQGCYFVVGGTLSNWAVQIRSSNTNNTATFRDQKSGATQSVAITVAAATTGVFEDTSTVETVTAGDVWGWLYDHGSISSGSITQDWRAVDFTSTGGASILFGTDQGAQIGVGATRFAQLLGDVAWSTTEAPVQAQALVAATYSHLIISVTVNSVATGGSYTHALRVTGTTSAVSVSVPHGTTGRFQDTVDTATVGAADLLDYQGVATGSSGNVFIAMSAVQLSPPPTEVSYTFVGSLVPSGGGGTVAGVFVG